MKSTGERKQRFGDGGRIGDRMVLGADNQIEAHGELFLLSAKSLSYDPFPVISDRGVSQSATRRDSKPRVIQTVLCAVDNQDGISGSVFCRKDAVERILALELESPGESFGLGMVFHASERLLVEFGVGDQA